MMRKLSPKDPDETITLTFDFTKDLTQGETLSGTPVVTISVYQGVDPNMNQMLSGAPQVAGNTVLQTCILGVKGNSYGVKAKCTTNSGRMLVLGGILPIQDASLQ